METDLKKKSGDSTDNVLRSTRVENPRHYTLKIQSFSLLKAALATSSTRQRYESQIFNAGGFKWKLALYPNGNEKRNGSNHISLYLVTAEDDIDKPNSSSVVNAVFTFMIYDALNDQYLTFRDGKERRLHAIKKEWGFDKLVSFETFNDASNGLLIDDCCLFGVDVTVMKCKNDKGKGEVLSLIKKPKGYQYTWKVNNFSQLSKDIYESDVFTVEGYNWKILLYPKGESLAKKGYMSLFLKFDNLEKLLQNFEVYVEFEFAVQSNQIGLGQTNYTGKNWFNGENNIRGFSFMLLSELKEPFYGFLRDDTLTVEVKLNVISTSKMFL